MTFVINVTGHDDLTGEQKVEFEKGLVEDVRILVDDLISEEGCNVTVATVNTNTTGVVNLLDPTENDV